MNTHLVLRVISKLMIPAILLFALYVQFHGDYGPGGGFQAGVIFASAFILHGIVFGTTVTRRVLPMDIVRAALAIGVLIYAGVGVLGPMFGYAFLDYDVIDHIVASVAGGGGAGPAGHGGEVHHIGQHYGILLIELGVGLTVATVMIAIFYAFASRPPRMSDADW